MTENEAIRIIGNIPVAEGYCQFDLSEVAEAYRAAKESLEEIQAYRTIGTVEKFKALKEKNETLKALYENARKEGNNLIIKARAEAVNEFANYLHEKAKENNGLRLSSETRSWTHPCIFDYLEEFKNEQICKEET